MSGAAKGEGRNSGPFKEGSKRNPYTALPITTGNSTAKFGQVRIDPSIRAIQDKGLGRIDEQYALAGQYGDELIGNSRSLRSRYMGNQSAYADAQLNPLREQIAAGRGERIRSNSLRGISGSSFGDQSLANYDSTTGRDLRDATANVEMQQLQALTGIDAQMMQQMFGRVEMQTRLNGESQEIAQARLQQELAALGLGLNQINMISQGFESWKKRTLEEGPYLTSAAVSGSFGGSGGGGGSSGSGGGTG